MSSGNLVVYLVTSMGREDADTQRALVTALMNNMTSPGALPKSPTLASMTRA